MANSVGKLLYVSLYTCNFTSTYKVVISADLIITQDPWTDLPQILTDS